MLHRKEIKNAPRGESPFVKDVYNDNAHASPSVLLHMVASGVAGGVSRFTTHPMDTIRTRMQIDRTGSDTNGKGMWAVGRSIIRAEGIRGLFSGVTLAVAVTAPALSLFLTTYDLSKAELVARGYSKDSLGVHVACGTMSEIVSGTLWTPMEVIKQKLQAQTAAKHDRVYKGGLHGIKHVFATEGLRGLYRGYFLTLSVYIPQTTTFFVLYERFKTMAKVHKNKSGGKLELVDFAFCSSAASVVAAAITCPFDVVKTRWQVQRGDVTAAVEGGTQPWMGLNYSSPSHLVKSILVEEGISGFFKGVGARVLWVAPSIAISMSCYEGVKRWSMKRSKTAQTI